MQQLEPSDPQAAVEVYCSFPLKPVAEQSFDDAFITGEIVRMLTTLEQYDHPQLGPNLVAYGKVMGLSDYCYYYYKYCRHSNISLRRSQNSAEVDLLSSYY